MTSTAPPRRTGRFRITNLSLRHQDANGVPAARGPAEPDYDAVV